MGSTEWTLALLCLTTAALAAWLAEHARAGRMARMVEAVQTAQEATLRLLRLSAGDQRNLALTLFGHAQAASPADDSLTALARRLLDMSEDLSQQTDAPMTPRFLAEEDIRLAPLVGFAVSQVAAQLGPSQRAWRLDPGFEHVRVFADRRALNQILVHVMSGAAATTRNGDWIELSGELAEGCWSIVVQDEGIGVPVSEAGIHPGESRGIGLRLTLARSLMQAHGGSLTVESTEHVGTRVKLGFPASRVTVHSDCHAGVDRAYSA